MLKKRKKFIEEYNKDLPKYKSLLPINIKDNIKVYNTDSWFTINKQTSKDNIINNLNYKTQFDNNIINCKKVKMILTNKQKDILNNWFDAYTLMYNETLKYIRNSCYLFRNNIIKKHLKDIPKKYTNFIYLRSKLLDIKKKIQQTTNNNKIHIHTLDYAIKQLVTNLKSAITNLKNGHIKRFRIKFWKLNRPSKTLDIEKENIKNNKLCYNIFGDIKYIYNNSIYELSNIKSNIKINYNSILNEYTLLIPNKNVPKEIKDKPRNIIFLDPGLRTFMTGLSEKEQFIIAPHINKLITIKLKRLYNIKSNINISNKIKKKNEKLINRKIYNMVDDLHWKVINFLILNFNNILLGNMSAKSIVSKKNSVLSNTSKKSCLMARYYVFKQRLEYKCKLTKTNFRLIDECYTSKICSNCGNYKEELKGEKIYNCTKCNISLDRDINGCRNIMIKSLMN